MIKALQGKRKNWQAAIKSLTLGAVYALGMLLPVSAHALSNEPNSASITFRINVRDVFPPIPVTDVAATGAGEKQISLTWTAPIEDANIVMPSKDPVGSYDVRFATYSVVDLLGDSTAWYNAADTIVFQPPVTPVAAGLLQGGITALSPATTYYFALKSTDESGNISDVDDNARLGGGAGQAKVIVPGIAAVTDLTGLDGTTVGSVRLTWTEPHRFGATNPLKYVVHISSLSQMNNEGDFNNGAIAQSVTALSDSIVPPIGAPGAPVIYDVTGLTPGVTYYFAVKAVEDTPTLPFKGEWLRDDFVLNTTNYHRAFFLTTPPDRVTNLTALPGTLPASIALSWTAPDVPGGAPVDRYVVHYSSLSVGDLAGDATAWFNLTSSTEVLVAPQAAGTTVTLEIDTLDFNLVYCFGIRSVDTMGQVSLLDVQSSGGGTQACSNTRAIPPIINLSAFSGDISGEVRLEWTEPVTIGLVPPLFYDIRVSSENPNLPGTGNNIDDNIEFAAASPLTAFSPTAVLTPNALGQNATSFYVQGLRPDTTYYFAIRMLDSNALPVITDWARIPLANINLRNFASARFLPAPPNAITDLTALTGTALEGDVDLNWTTPTTPNFALVSGYEVRYNVLSVDTFLGDTDAWWDASVASRTAFNVTPEEAGARVQTTVGGLLPSTTFFFGVRGLGKVGEVGLIDFRSTVFSQQNSTTPFNMAPAVPTGLLASGGLRESFIDWDDLPDGIGGKGLDFAHYRLQRSTASDFSATVVDVTTTTAISFNDKPLAAFTTFYFRLGAVDQAGNESVFSSTARATPFTLRPQQPFGVSFDQAGSSITLSWGQTTRFEDGTPFVSTSAPAADELTGYELYRSTGACDPFSLVGTNTFDAPSITDTWVGNDAFYYVIRSSNRYLTSADSLVVTPFGAQLYQLEDCISHVAVEPDQVPVINRGTNGFDEDILISRRTRTEDQGGKVLKAVEFIPLLGGHTELSNFHFTEAIPVVLHFSTNAAGGPAVQGVGVSGIGAAATQGNAALDHLGIFWDNGVEYKKLYGKIDTLGQTVAVNTPNLGKFQLRTLVREGGVTLDLSNITSRVLTPNGDGKNDSILFLFDNPNGTPVEGKMYDLRGAFVADMAAGIVPNSLTWDGRMNGTVVTGGVYMYQIKGEGKTFNGTIVVAR